MALNIDDLIDRLLTVGQQGSQGLTNCVTEQEVVLLCNAAREVFMSQPPFLEVEPPIKVRLWTK